MYLAVIANPRLCYSKRRISRSQTFTVLHHSGLVSFIWKTSLSVLKNIAYDVNFKIGDSYMGNSWHDRCDACDGSMWLIPENTPYGAVPFVKRCQCFYGGKVYKPDNRAPKSVPNGQRSFREKYKAGNIKGRPVPKQPEEPPHPADNPTAELEFAFQNPRDSF